MRSFTAGTAARAEKTTRKESTRVVGRPNSSAMILSPARAMFTALRRFESIISPSTRPSTIGAAGYPLLLIRKPAP